MLFFLLAAAGLAAQPELTGLTLSTTAGTYTLPAPASLTNDALLAAISLTKLALTTATTDTLSLAKERDRIEAQIATSGDALKKATEALKEEQAPLQPAIDAFTRDSALLKADDDRLQRDKAPLQAEIDAYNATPENNRTETEYKRLAGLSAPFDARRAELAARLTALNARYAALEQSLGAVQQPHRALQKRDNELQAERKLTTATLGDAYRQLQAGHDYAVELARLYPSASSTLGAALVSAKQALKGLSNLGLAVVPLRR